MKCARCGGSGWVMFGYGETAGADACPVCIEGPEDMNLSFQPPEEDDPRDDDQRANALLPCPFCGNAKNIAIVNERHDHSGGYYIACPVCDASTGIRFACGDDPAPLLIEQWNRRATQPTASNAELEASYTATTLAEMILSDCGHSTENTRLLERVAKRIDKYADTIGDARAALATQPTASNAGERSDGLRAALQDITDDYADRFDLDCPSTNPGIKHVIRQARAALAQVPEQVAGDSATMETVYGVNPCGNKQWLAWAAVVNGSNVVPGSFRELSVHSDEEEAYRAASAARTSGEAAK